ncbi:unnamed protein product, partial [Owenia fusiformis]
GFNLLAGKVVNFRNRYLFKLNVYIHSVRKMVQLYVKIPGDPENCPEWAILELQGDLQSRNETGLSGKYIGGLHFSKSDQPIMIIGHHILHGKIVKLEKPLAVLSKNQQMDTSSNSDLDKSLTDNDSDIKIDNKDIHYLVQAVITRKLVFKTRPKPIIANVPKKL